MGSIKEQIAALRARFEKLEATLAEQAKSNAELREKLAKLNDSIDLLVEVDERAKSLIRKFEKK